MRVLLGCSSVLSLLSAAACSDAPTPAPDPYAPVDSGAPLPGDGAANDGGAASSGDPDGADAGDKDAALGGEPAGLRGTGLTPFATDGEPLDVEQGAWTYVEFPDSSCRDGSKAGITVRRNALSKKLMFFFEGGGACFDSLTCSANPASVDDRDRGSTKNGILDVSRDDNPFKDWNIVYVPYCTGDVFAGTKADGKVDGVGPQKFVGYLNTQAFLQRVVPTFGDLTDLLVTGVSAGGFGASANVVLIQRAFPEVPVKLLNDSGPPMSSDVLPTCLQKRWRETWGLDRSIIADCGADCPDPDDFSFPFGVSLARRFAGRYSGLIESTEDSVISGFYGAGTNPLGGGECTGVALLTPVAPEKFRAGLLAFRAALADYPTFGTYFPPGTQHTWLGGASFYEATLEGTPLRKWVSDIVDGVAAAQLGGK